MKLRPVIASDCNIILKWRNAPSIRKFMFNPAVIPYKAHKAWFNQALLNPNKKMYLLVDENELLGFIQFDLSVIDQKTVIEWGFYKGKNSRAGLGSRLLELAMIEAFENLKAAAIIGNVIGSNLRSIALHKKLGFTELLGQSDYLQSNRCVNVTHFQLDKDTWYKLYKEEQA